MLPMCVFVSSQGGLEEACSVDGWPAAWDAIDACYRGELEPLAWVVVMTRGDGPVTTLHLMDATMWGAVAEDWRALRDYLLLSEPVADPLLPAAHQAGGWGGSAQLSRPEAAEPCRPGLAASAALPGVSRGTDLCAPTAARERRPKEPAAGRRASATRSGCLQGAGEGEARSAKPFPRYMQIKTGKQGGPGGKDAT